MGNNNMELWDKVEKTPVDIIIKTDAGGGKKLNSVKSINRIKKATEQFGMYGIKWGLKDVKHKTEKLNSLFIAVVDVIFFVHSGDVDLEFEISSSIGIMVLAGDKWEVNTSYRKALESDVINKALSRLGFFADIYTDNELIKPEGTVEIESDSMELIEIPGDE